MINLPLLNITTFTKEGKMQTDIKSEIKDYLILTVATFIMDLGIYIFKYPNHFSFGGVTGISILLSHITPLSTGTINFIFNITLLVIGIIFIGKGFALRTVYISVLSSLFILFLEKNFPMSAPLTNQPLLELVFAILLPAVASAIMFNMQASSGGTDIVAMILKKYTSVNIGVALLAVDSVIAISSFFVFDVTTGLFASLGLLSKSVIIDNVIESMNTCKYFNIITNNPDMICDFICKKLDRSATVFEAKGAFSHENKFVVMSAMKRYQAVELRNFIRQNDPKAFILISNTSEIIGKGFRGIN